MKVACFPVPILEDTVKVVHCLVPQTMEDIAEAIHLVLTVVDMMVVNPRERLNTHGDDLVTEFVIKSAALVDGGGWRRFMQIVGHELCGHQAPPTPTTNNQQPTTNNTQACPCTWASVAHT